MGKNTVITEKRLADLNKVRNNADLSTKWDNVISVEVVTFYAKSLFDRYQPVKECKAVKIHFANKHSKMLRAVMMGKIADHEKAERICTDIDVDGYLSEKFNVWTGTEKESADERTLKRAVAFFGTLTDSVSGQHMFKIVSLNKLAKYQALVDDTLIERDSIIQSAVRGQFDTASKWTDAEIDALYADIKIEK